MTQSDLIKDLDSNLGTTLLTAVETSVVCHDDNAKSGEFTFELQKLLLDTSRTTKVGQIQYLLTSDRNVSQSSMWPVVMTFQDVTAVYSEEGGVLQTDDKFVVVAVCQNGLVFGSY